MDLPLTHILDAATGRFIRLKDDRVTVLPDHAVQALCAIALLPGGSKEEQAELAGMRRVDFDTSLTAARIAASRCGDDFFERKIIAGTKGSFRLATEAEAKQELRKPQWVVHNFASNYQYAIDVETGDIENLTRGHLQKIHIGTFDSRVFTRLVRIRHVFQNVAAVYHYSDTPYLPPSAVRLDDKFFDHLTHTPFIRTVRLPEYPASWARGTSRWISVVDFTKPQQKHHVRLKAAA